MELRKTKLDFGRSMGLGVCLLLNYINRKIGLSTIRTTKAFLANGKDLRQLFRIWKKEQAIRTTTLEKVGGDLKKIYMAHPLRGDVESNLKSADQYLRKLQKFDDCEVFSPLHEFADVDPEGDQRGVMVDCIKALAECDELWVCGDDVGAITSRGVQAEIAFAKAVGISICKFKASDTPDV